MKLKEILFGGAVKGMEPRGGGGAAGSVQDWLPVRNIVDGVVITKDSRFVKIIETMPVNFHLKTPREQQTIIYYFASYLKIAPSNLQIRVVTQRLDLDGYISQMKGFLKAEENEKCRELIEDNIAEVTDIAANQVNTRRFFIIFQYEPRMKARSNTIRAVAERLAEEAETARRYLDLCGLEVIEPAYTDNAALELLYELINKRTGQRVRLPGGVFDMMTEVHGIYGNQGER